MAQIQFTTKIGGVLTNVTSVVLCDPTAIYGVRRDDDGGILVAANTAMINPAAGTYAYTFTEIDGVQHTAWIKWSYGGETHYQEVVYTPALPAAAEEEGGGVTTVGGTPTVPEYGIPEGGLPEPGGVVAVGTLELCPHDECLLEDVDVLLADFGEAVTVHPPDGSDERACTAIVTRAAGEVAHQPRLEQWPFLVQLPNDVETGISGAEWESQFEITVPRYRGSAATTRVRTVKAVHQDAAMITWGCR
jgi:hypothetical protein